MKTLSFIALSASVVSTGQAEKTVQFRVTFRDFLPSFCLAKSEYIQGWGLAESTAYSGLSDLDYSNATSLENKRITAPSYPDLLASIYCPYWDDMRAGRISGHPDFEANNYINGPSCVIGCDLTGSPPISPTVANNISSAGTSGLRKPLSCTDNLDKQCGYGCMDAAKTDCRYTFSKSRYFQSWYNDAEKYNKRIGYKLTLELDPATDQYFFDSDKACTPPPGKTKCREPKWNPLQKYVDIVNTQTYMEKFPNFRDAPAWVNSLEGTAPAFTSGSSSNSITDYSGDKFWYTTEIHTYFEYSGKEFFRFVGDDDVWVYINGRLAVDLGGLHPPAKGFVNLSKSEEYFDLEVGKVYPFDMFHAERHTDGSNFRIETTLTTSCNVARDDANEVSFSTENATDSDLFVYGAASLSDDNSIIYLSTNQSDAYSPSSVFLKQKQNVGPGFIASFSFRFLQNGTPEGFAFVLHNQENGLSNLPVSVGSGLNFRNLRNSLAVVFDVCEDRKSGQNCDVQSVRVHYPKDNSTLNGPDANTVAVYDYVMRSLRFDEENHTARVEYLENPPWLEVYIDDSLYLRQENFYIRDIVGARTAFMGFTSSTSQSPATVEIFDWEVKTVAIDVSRSVSIDIFPDSEPKSIPADGLASADYSFYTRDNCLNKIEYGGFANLASGVFVEVIPALMSNSTNSTRLRTLEDETQFNNMYSGNSLVPQIIPAQIVDHGNGTYSVRLQSTTPGTFALYTCFGLEGCSYNVTLEDVSEDGFPEGLKVAVVTRVGGPVGFEGMVKNAASVIPLTQSPTIAPITIPPSTPQQDDSIKYAAIIGGSCLGVFVCIAAAMIHSRRKWKGSKGFVEEGRLYNIDKDLTYDKSENYSVIGRALLGTRSEIMKERARTIRTPKDAQINSLREENDALKEEVRMNKVRTQLNESSTTPRGGVLGGPAAGRARKEFPQSEDF